MSARGGLALAQIMRQPSASYISLCIAAVTLGAVIFSAACVAVVQKTSSPNVLEIMTPLGNAGVAADAYIGIVSMGIAFAETSTAFATLLQRSSADHSLALSIEADNAIAIVDSSNTVSRDIPKRSLFCRVFIWLDSWQGRHCVVIGNGITTVVLLARHPFAQRNTVDGKRKMQRGNLQSQTRQLLDSQGPL